MFGYRAKYVYTKSSTNMAMRLAIMKSLALRMRFWWSLKTSSHEGEQKNFPRSTTLPQIMQWR